MIIEPNKISISEISVASPTVENTPENDKIGTTMIRKKANNRTSKARRCKGLRKLNSIKHVNN